MDWALRKDISSFFHVEIAFIVKTSRQTTVWVEYYYFLHHYYFFTFSFSLFQSGWTVIKDSLGMPSWSAGGAQQCSLGIAITFRQEWVCFTTTFVYVFLPRHIVANGCICLQHFVPTERRVWRVRSFCAASKSWCVLTLFLCTKCHQYHMLIPHTKIPPYNNPHVWVSPLLSLSYHQFCDNHFATAWRKIAKPCLGHPLSSSRIIMFHRNISSQISQHFQVALTLICHRFQMGLSIQNGRLACCPTGPRQSGGRVEEATSRHKDHAVDEARQTTQMTMDVGMGTNQTICFGLKNIWWKQNNDLISTPFFEGLIPFAFFFWGREFIWSKSNTNLLLDHLTKNVTIF